MKINKCPKCGREPKVIRIKSITDYGVKAECYCCRLYTGYCKTFAEAVTKWNKMTKGETNETTETK